MIPEFKKISLLISITLLLASCRSRFSDADLTGIAQTNGDIIESFTLDLKEVSGFSSVITSNDGKKGFYVVGDRKFEIKFIEFDASSADPKAEQKSYKKMIQDSPKGINSDETSQWEAIQVLGRQFLFIAEENRQLIHIVDIKRGRYFKSIILKKNSDSKPALIEFGPPGSTAEGFTKTNRAEVSDTVQSANNPIFGLSKSNTIELEPLKIWMSHESNPKGLDISEITTVPNGDLVVLSDQLQGIFHVEKGLKPSENTYRFISRLDLPKKIKKPEGLIAISESDYIVGSDTTDNDPNIYHIRSLP
ncbi:MAG: hypothetical protein NT027_18230 [Proteobacteria bacterium]|nr:hypothetical protein [Pseudomonadota bacterium]